MASYSNRDISLIPDITFSFVESYIRTCRDSSGDKAINKGFKYYSEGFVHDLKVEPMQDACKVWGKCYHSQKRNEKPHEMQVCFTTKTTDICIHRSSCDCPIGLSGRCGHVAGLMYQIANYKTLGLKALPEDIAKTSQPQTWHIPRGTKITGKAVQDLEVSGHSKEDPCEAMPRNIKSTLYNPVRGQPIDWCVNARKLSAVSPDLLVLPALSETACSVPCSFGPVPKGCILSYQQKPIEDCILNISDGIGFPELPASNVMRNTYSTVLSSQKSVKLEGLKLTLHEVKKFEEQTRLQVKLRSGTRYENIESQLLRLEKSLSVEKRKVP